MEDKDLWVRLGKKLNSTGGGFYTTESGSEIAMLKKIFTEEEVRVYLSLENKMEPAQVIAARLNRSPEELQPLFGEMCRKMMLLRTPTNPVFYRPVPFVPGIAEAAFSRASEEKDTEALELYDQYWHVDERRLKAPILRTVPVRQALGDKTKVAPYDDVRGLIDRAGKIAVMRCPCDVMSSGVGRDIKGPIERCLVLGLAADMITAEGWGRYITGENAHEILNACEEAGLVPQLENLDNPTHICSCGKNCPELRQKKLLPRPADIADSNYYAEVDTDACTGCGVCVDRCVMEAVAVGSQGTAEVDPARCVGCGLCVTKCPTEAITLKEKDPGNRYIPADTHWSAITPREIMQELKEYKDVRFNHDSMV